MPAHVEHLVGMADAEQPIADALVNLLALKLLRVLRLITSMDFVAPKPADGLSTKPNRATLLFKNKNKSFCGFQRE